MRDDRVAFPSDEAPRLPFIPAGIEIFPEEDLGGMVDSVPGRAESLGQESTQFDDLIWPEWLERSSDGWLRSRPSVRRGRR